MSLRPSLLVAPLAALAAPASALAPFDDLAFPTPPAAVHQGPGGAAGTFYDGRDGAGGFTSGGLFFANAYNAAWASWSGWAWSTVTDAATPGFGNQFAAWPGAGHASAAYAIAYTGNGGSFVTLPAGLDVPVSARVANATYAALSMRDGDAFAKRFGGASGTDPDWFRLTITGLDALGATTGAVAFYLADFRFEDPTLDGIVEGWSLVDLSGLGSGVRTLRFDLESSDVGMFGMNTPATFALDDLVVVPEPSVAALAFVGLALVLGRRAVLRR